jgi:Peptidase_C39 like family
MQTQSTAPVACCAALLIMTVPLMARAASNNLVLTDAEPQYASKLCWAAADVLAVNNFYPHCPATTSTAVADPALFPTSQALEAANNRLQISGSSATLSSYLSECETSIGICNYWGTPLLHGLTFKWGTPAGLSWEAMTQEIDAGRPVVFVWDYLSDGTDSSSPVGLHELVVIGYSDDTGTQQLQIWDPWPVPEPLPSEVPACGPASGIQVTEGHSQTIDFSTYSDPMSDMGVSADHVQDQWDLAVSAVPDAPVLTVDGAAPQPQPSPPPFHKLPQPPQKSLRQVRFAEALHAALLQSRQINLQVPGAAPRSLGIPFPIVGLGFQQLLSAVNDPTRLLVGSTSAILFPVESQGKVVDAFLLLFIDHRWQRRGYANVEITRRLVDVRARYAAQRHLPLHSFYMVSVPGEVAFFAAYGKGKKAILIPASTDPTIDAVAGGAVPAEAQLLKLIHAIQSDLRRNPPP